jgi:hypothetical protein
MRLGVVDKVGTEDSSVTENFHFETSDWEITG